MKHIPIKRAGLDAAKKVTYVMYAYGIRYGQAMGQVIAYKNVKVTSLCRYICSHVCAAGTASLQKQQAATLN